MRSSCQVSQNRRSKKAHAGQPRTRPINSCLTCRDRKKGCDRGQPVCSNCIQNPDPNKPCVYYATGKAEVLRVHKRKMQSLKEDFASTIAKESVNGGNRIQDLTTHTPASDQNALEEDGDDGSASHGFCLGKVHISDSFRAAFRPITVEELTYALESSAPLYPENVLNFHLRPSPVEFTEPIRPLMTLSNFHLRSPLEIHRDFLQCPERRTSELLLQNYWANVHPIARVLHRPSFTVLWMTFWESHGLGSKIDKSSLALVIATLLAASVSMPDDVVQRELKREKSDLVQQMRVAADNALARSNWIHSTQIETLQAIVIYLITICCDEVTRAHSNVVAAAIRAAEGLGIHEEGTVGQYTADQIQIRRLIWYQLLVLDIKTCEATGTRPQQRKGDFSTQMPFNLDEDMVGVKSIARQKWTDMTAMIIRFSCNEFIREIWNDCLRLELEHVSLSETLLRIRTFDAHIQRAFGNITDLHTPIQKYSLLVARTLISGTYARVLRQYAFHPEVQISDDLTKIFIKYGVQTMEALRELDTGQDLDQWRWFSGSIQQHQNALAMLLELLKNPYLNQAPQLVSVLDYFFEPPADLASIPLIRIRYIATKLRDHMDLHVARREKIASRDIQGIQDVSNLEYFDQSTCNSSATPGGASPTTQTSSSLEKNESGTSALPPDFVSVQQDTECSMQTSNMLAFQSQPQQYRRYSERQIIDIDPQIFVRCFPDAINTNLMMSAEEVHAFYGISCSLPNPSPSGWIPKPGFHNKTRMSGTPSSPSVAAGATDLSLKEPEDFYPNFYLIDDFTGYRENSPFIAEPSFSISAASSPSTHSAHPFNSFSGAPIDQSAYNSPDDQQRHIYSTFTPYPHQSTHGAVLFNDGESKSQSTSQSQIACQGYEYLSGLDGNVVAYDGMIDAPRL